MLYTSSMPTNSFLLTSRRLLFLFRRLLLYNVIQVKSVLVVYFFLGTLPVVFESASSNIARIIQGRRRAWCHWWWQTISGVESSTAWTRAKYAAKHAWFVIGLATPWDLYTFSVSCWQYFNWIVFPCCRSNARRSKRHFNWIENHVPLELAQLKCPCGWFYFCHFFRTRFRRGLYGTSSHCRKSVSSNPIVLV